MFGFIILTFISAWVACAYFSLLVKKRIKLRYPDLHADIYPDSILKNDIKIGYKLIRFSLNSAMWREIEDPALLSQLHYQRVLLVLVAVMLFTFILAIPFYGVAGA